MTRVVIVDDSRLMRTMLRAALDADPRIEVVGEGADPYEARDVIRAANPDVVTLDVEMPRMGGLEFLRLIMKLRPTPVVMVSSLTAAGAETTLAALELGAVDFIPKPSGREDWPAFSGAICEKVCCAARAQLRTPGDPAARPGAAAAAPLAGGAAGDRAQAGRARAGRGEVASLPARCELVAIGASTGGVSAIHRLLDGIPGNLPPIVITQHMPPSFTSRFAERLGAATGLDSGEASHAECLRPGTIRIAPGDRHLRIERRQGRLICLLSDGPQVTGHRPSVDVLFDSVAESAGAQAVGLILTGMGRDGAEGLKRMRAAGACTLGESSASCTVYGMPKAAMEIGAVAQEMPLDDLADRLRALGQKAATLSRAG